MQNVKTVYLNALRGLFPDQMVAFDNAITMSMQSIMVVQRAIGQKMGEVTMSSQSPSEYLRELSKYSVVLTDLYDYLDSLLHESAPAHQTADDPASIYAALYHSPNANTGAVRKEKSSPVDIALKAMAGESLFTGPFDTVRNMEEEDRVSLPYHLPEVPFTTRNDIVKTEGPEPKTEGPEPDAFALFDVPDAPNVPVDTIPDDALFEEVDAPSAPVYDGTIGNVQDGYTRPRSFVFRGEERKFITYGSALCTVAVYAARMNPDAFVQFCNTYRSDPVFARTVSNEDAMITQMTGAMCIVRGYFIDNDRDDRELVNYISKLLEYFGLRTEEFYFLYGNEEG